ncbi:DUF1697 domain-containing protein [Arthrobacter sp. SX1312]|uniref:DUF1697 domain-containing protein n=1 Tax=Arthrobacter sp. SX1312 TaxID=2058896 RepID=UPI000CE4DC9D|nr:DUF1697 domain-containing protein [Arthrobacter sp. SX1312]
MGEHAPGTGRRYAIFLRGVNVGGVTIRMADLRELLAGLPVGDVATVLASGNATCSSALAAEQLTGRVEEALRARFGYPARVIVVERAELAGIAASVPEQGNADTHTYVTLFTGPDEQSAFVDEARGLGEEPVALTGGTAIAWFPPKGRSTDVPLAKLLARTRHAANSTTRNLNTVDKVLRLLA